LPLSSSCALRSAPKSRQAAPQAKRSSSGLEKMDMAPYNKT
jgi:hypothetical protein